MLIRLEPHNNTAHECVCVNTSVILGLVSMIWLGLMIILRGRHINTSLTHTNGVSAEHGEYTYVGELDLWGVMHVFIAHLLMMVHGMVLGEVVGQVVHAWLPFDGEQIQVHLIPDPVVPHVDGLGLFLFHGAVGDADRTRVVTDDERGLLLVAKVGENVTDTGGFAANEKEGCILGLSGRGNHGADDAAEVIDGAIDAMHDSMSLMISFPAAVSQMCPSSPALAR